MKNGTRLQEHKNRIALLVQYEGTNFNGCQSQANGRTVQDEIEKALKVLFRKNIRIVVSGRTDAGVHAAGQVIHFDLDVPVKLQKLCINLNGILERDISIKNAYIVPPTFHARFSAVSREYLYMIYNYPQRSPLFINKAVWINSPLDVNFLRSIATFLTGEKDFASFCKKKSAEENTVRRIDRFDIKKINELIIMKIAGNAFLHNMIRIIAGTMLEMAKNGKEPSYVLEILEEKDRNAAGKTAPACGLYLNRIIYDPPLSSMESAF